MRALKNGDNNWRAMITLMWAPSGVEPPIRTIHRNLFMSEKKGRVSLSCTYVYGAAAHQVWKLFFHSGLLCIYVLSHVSPVANEEVMNSDMFFIQKNLNLHYI